MAPIKPTKPKPEQKNPADSHISRRMVAIVIAAALLILSFILIRPYIAAVLTGIFLAYIFYIPYIKLNKVVKKPGIAAAIICIIVLVVVGLAIYFIAQKTISESFNLYMSVKELDMFDVVKTALTNVAPELSQQITVTLEQSAISLTNAVINAIGRILTNAPQLIIQFFVVLFVFFYFLKEGKKSISYLKQILPFKPETNERFLARSKQIAKATIAGQIAVGIIQGALAGILFFIFRNPIAASFGMEAPPLLFFTLLAAFAGILPFIGPWIVFVPIGLIMIASGAIVPGILLIVIGIAVNTAAGEPLRALIIGKKGRANPAVILIGMLGGLALIGPIGLVAGPLILEYMILFIDLYRMGKMH